MSVVAPEVLWAQRSSDIDASKNIIYLSINAPELQPDYTLDITPSKIFFKGATKAAAGSIPHRQYAFDLELFDEIDPEPAKATEHLTGKSLCLVLKKKDLKEDYWPRLSKDKRVNFVKTDFSKWKDQDEQDGDPDDDGEMGGMPDLGGMGGMPGMGGMGNMPGMDGMGGMDFEKMMAQMKDVGGTGGEGDEDDLGVGGSGSTPADDDDDDMPPLEES